MNRRNLIKGLAALGALSILPISLIPDKTIKKRIHYIGLGDAGCRMVDFIQKNKHPRNASFISISRNRKADLSPQIMQLSFFVEEHGTHQLLTPEIRDIFTKENRYILIGGLGGITGTYLFKTLNHWLFTQNYDFLSVCSIPFRFEGPRRTILADPIIQQFKNRPNFLYFAADIVREIHGNLSLGQAFGEVDNLLYELTQKYLEENV